MTNEVRELNLTDLDAVSGGDLGIVEGIVLSVVANAVYDVMKDTHGVADVMNWARQQAGK
jgi:hypothetical protein